MRRRRRWLLGVGVWGASFRAEGWGGDGDGAICWELVVWVGVGVSELYWGGGK